jgi:hypothetical protein
MDNMKNKSVRLITELPAIDVAEVRSEWFYVDGFRVNSNVHEMANALRADRAFRECRFHPMGNNGGYEGAATLFVYFPDEIYTRGSIGFRDVGVEESINQFFVNAKSITNGKVRWHKWQHHTSGSTNMKRAIKSAKEHLRALSTSDIVDITVTDVSGALRDRVDAADRETTNKKIVLRDLLDPTGALTSELRLMIAKDYEFGNEALRGDVINYLDSIDAEKSETSRKIMITLAIIYPPRREGMEQQIVTQKLGEPLLLSGYINDSAIIEKLNKNPNVVYSESTLPADTRAKLATLSINEAGRYVDGLGARVSANVYYLAADCE